MKNLLKYGGLTLTILLFCSNRISSNTTTESNNVTTLINLERKLNQYKLQKIEQRILTLDPTNSHN